MQSVTNISTETIFVPALGRTLTPGESCDVADTSLFAGHPLLKIGGVALPAPPEVAPAPAPEPEPAPVPSSSVSQSAPETIAGAPKELP